MACTSDDLHGEGILACVATLASPPVGRGAALHSTMMVVGGRWWSSADRARRGQMVRRCGCGGGSLRLSGGVVNLGVLNFTQKPCLALCRCRQRRHSRMLISRWRHCRDAYWILGEVLLVKMQFRLFERVAVATKRRFFLLGASSWRPRAWL